MPRDFVPRPYQALMVQHALARKRCALFAGMGMGKTTATLQVIDALLLAGEVQRALVLAPLRVARSTWPDEVKKWRQFAHLRVGFIDAWLPEETVYLRAWNALRKAEAALDEARVAFKDAPSITAEARLKAATADARAAEQHADKLRPAASSARLAWCRQFDIVTVNYDVLPQIVGIQAAAWEFDLVVADELTRVKSYRSMQGGKQAHALSQVAHTHAARFLGLTGTPAPNGVKDLWGQMWFIDKGHRLGLSYSAFLNRWFRMKPGSDPKHQQVELMPHSQVEIENQLRDVCLTVNPKDWFDITDPITHRVEVTLPPLARVKYREMEDEMFTEIEENPVEAFSAAGKSMKLLQIASGAAYVDDERNWHEVHDEKIQALRSIVEEAAGMPVLVAYHFQSDLARLQKAFPKGKVLDKKPRTLTDWNAGRIPVLFAHPQSAGHGLNMQDGGNILVFFTTTWNLECDQQIIERIGPVRQMQAGHNRPVFIYRIVAKGTVDEAVLKRIETKREVQDLLLEALKERKHGNTEDDIT